MIASVLAVVAAATLTQEPAPQAQDEALRVYLDCRWEECDADFFRTEVTYVNWVRDRADAQVAVLVTALSTAAGGTEYTMTLIGQQRFAGWADTVRAIALVESTYDDRRRALIRTMGLALARYLATTPLAPHLALRFTPPGVGTAAQRERRDPWNRWVTRLEVQGYFTGEQATAGHSLVAGVSAGRVTEEWKINAGLALMDDRSRHTLPGDSILFTRKWSDKADVSVVRSIGPHWSVGGGARVTASTFGNEKLLIGGGPAIEYSVLPYARATREQLTAYYTLEVSAIRYHAITIHQKTREVLVSHQLRLSLALKQPWGYVNGSASGRQYFADPGHPNVDLSGKVSVRLVRGLSVQGGATYGFVRSQRSLQFGDATQEEVLLDLREMRTTYNYFAWFGLAYTFGSVYNNVVNPRFGG